MHPHQGVALSSGRILLALRCATSLQNLPLLLALYICCGLDPLSRPAQPKPDTST